MRKQNKIIVWPIYFDSNKTRNQGRRIPKNLSISSPKLVELQSATKKLGMLPEIVYDATHPSCPWRKTGLIILPKTESKSRMLNKIAKKLTALRK